jgi:hypothetical protein
MSHVSSIWCAHPSHDVLLPNEKKRFWKTGPKPSHPKGKRSTSEDLAEFINDHHQAIINGSSSKISKDDYLCSWCFAKEATRFTCSEKEEEEMDTSNREESPDGNNSDRDSDDDEDSPIDDAYVFVEQEDAKRQLNEVFELVNVKKIDDM